MIALTVPDIAARLNARIADLACALLGEPNRVLSSRAQLRFGKKGSVAVEIDGADAGKWFDHEAGVGGDGLELIRHRNGIANGEACDWARRWLGLDAEASAAGSRSNAGKVAHIVARSEAIAGTRVEAYLRSRGITASPPDCIRFRPFAAGPYGALVALATDASGAVLAVQQIYLTEDGRKAPVDVVKRTNKAVDGWSERAALRLPGAAPVVLCEGVETALSIWQATGRETWACFGIANISRAPVPQGAPVIVARDGDEPDSKADRQLWRAVAGLRARGHDVGVASPPQGTDFNDVLQNDGEQAVRDLIARTAAGRPPPACAPTCSPTWRDGLLLNHAGEPRAVLANAIHALRHAPDWDGVLWHDAFATATVARRAPPWASDRKADWTATAWSDTDDCLVAEWLQRQGIAASVVTAGQAAETVARERQFHPVRDYLDGLTWDGTARLDRWLVTYLGAADTAYLRAVGARWLISAVARIFVPGCQADCVLILEGPQGIRKSSALGVLARPWFTDRLSDLRKVDSALETRGVWIIELAELDTMASAATGTIKAYISRRQDRYRPPYGKRMVDLPRQCVFAGSVNPEGGYLKDPTGGRRFWPVMCGRIDLDALERDRDQLWAEARDRFRRREPWWLETRDLEALAAEQQAERYQGDAWDEPIRAYLDHETRDDVSVAEVLERAIRIERGRWTQGDLNRVVRVLVSMGFRRYRASHGQRERRYRRDSLESCPGCPGP